MSEMVIKLEISSHIALVIQISTSKVTVVTQKIILIKTFNKKKTNHSSET